MDVLTPAQRHKNMSHIRSKNTKAEILLRKALWNRGVRYRKNYKLLPGKPDIVVLKCHIAIFVDGDFWHGKDFETIKKRIGTNKKFWIEKLKRNIERDEEINDRLTEMGWLVLRFWDSEIKKDLDSCVNNILDYMPAKNK